MANKKLSAVITIGGAVAGSLLSSIGKTKGALLEVGGALRNLEGQQRLLSKSIKEFGGMGKNVDGLRGRYATVTSQIDRLRAAYQQLHKVESATQANLERRAQLRGEILDSVAIGAAALAPIKIAADFETAMLGVAKQLNGARDASGRLTASYFDMQRQIQQLGREIPITTKELADMVTAGLRMGVAGDQVLGFTRTAAMMADAFELPAGQLAEDMGKIAGLFKIPIPAIGELADSINYLDDNAISKSGDIIDFLTRTGGVSSSVKITGKEMAAVGSTLLTLGERAETASTATNALFQKLAAADKGTKKFHGAMKEIGLSTDAIQKGMQKDAMGTVLKVMDAIGKLPKEKQLGVMVDLIGLEHSDTLAKLANGTRELRRQLELTNSEAAKGSMSREFAARLQTTNAQFTIMKNRVHELAVNIGSALLPGVNALLGVLSPVVEKIADFARENPKLTQSIVGTVVALTSLNVASKVAAYGFTFLKGGFLQIAGVAARMRAGFVLVRGALPGVIAGVRGVGAAFSATGIGAIVAGIALAGQLIYQHWDGVAAFFRGVGEGITAGMQPVVQVFRDFGASLSPLQPAFDAVGSALKTAWQWFTDLLAPVQYSSAELKAAGEAGRSFGQSLAAGITIALKPLTLLIEGITWLNNNIGAAMAKAIAFKNAIGDKVGGAIDGVKDFFDGSPSPAPAGAPARSVPAVPSVPAGRGGARSFTDNSTNTYQITQQPGESSRDLAKRIIEEQNRQRQIKQRGALYDGATAQ